MAAAQGYDAVYILIYSLFSIRDGNLSGPAIKAALATKARTYYGVVATDEQPFSVKDKDATTQNMLVLGMVKNGAVTVAHFKDAKRNLFYSKKEVIYLATPSVSRSVCALLASNGPSTRASTSPWRLSTTA